MRTRYKVVLFVALGTLVVAVGACTPSDTSSDTSIASSAEATNPYGAGLVDPPQHDEAILKVNVRGSVSNFSLDSLKDLPATTIDLFEPFVKIRASFTGVSLADLFDTVGISAADSVVTVALNEYEYDNTARMFTASDGLLAYEQDGHPIPVDRGGPIRIVFPDGSALSVALEAWNWALSSITVK